MPDYKQRHIEDIINNLQIDNNAVSGEDVFWSEQIDLKYEVEKTKRLNRDLEEIRNNERTHIPNMFDVEQITSDFNDTRNMLIQLIAACRELLKRIPTSVGLLKASMITAIATLNNSINANAKLLLEIHEKIIKMQIEQEKEKRAAKEAEVEKEKIKNLSVTNNFNIAPKDLNRIIMSQLNDSSSPQN